MIGVTIQGDGIFSTISLGTPEFIAAWRYAVESSLSNPHHEALASRISPEATFATRSGLAHSADAETAQEQRTVLMMVNFMATFLTNH